jgi:hypothetical protein
MNLRLFLIVRACFVLFAILWSTTTNAEEKEKGGDECDADKFHIDGFSEQAFHNQKLSICLKDDASNLYFIDKDALADRLVNLAYLPLNLRKKIVVVDNKISISRNYMINYRVFGNPSSYNEEEKCNFQKSVNIKAQLASYFSSYLQDDKEFRLVINSSKAPNGNLTPTTFFEKDSPYRIQCIIKAKPKEPDEKNLPKLVKNGKLRVGAGSDDLFKDLSKSKTFTFDVKDDRIKGQASVGVEGVAGIVFSTSLPYLFGEGDEFDNGIIGANKLQFAVFSQIKYYDQDPDSKAKPDIGYVAPGVALRFETGTANFATELQLDANPVFDDKNGSVTYSTRALYSPGIRLPNGKMLFTDPFAVIGPLRVIPDVNLVSSYTLVETAGTNSKLVQVSEYFGLGFDTSLEFFFVDVPKFLEDFSLSVGYSERHYSSDIGEADRMWASLAYNPDKKNFSIKAEYAYGSDFNTLQDEDRISFGLGFRY